MTRLERLVEEGKRLRRISRALARLEEEIDRELDQVTVAILRHEFRLTMQKKK